MKGEVVDRSFNAEIRSKDPLIELYFSKIAGDALRMGQSGVYKNGIPQAQCALLEGCAGAGKCGPEESRSCIVRTERS